jgi:hypothetical protein
VSPIRNGHDCQLFRSSAVDQFVTTKAQLLPWGQSPNEDERELGSAEYSVGNISMNFVLFLNHKVHLSNKCKFCKYETINELIITVFLDFVHRLEFYILEITTFWKLGPISETLCFIVFKFSGPRTKS